MVRLQVRTRSPADAQRVLDERVKDPRHGTLLVVAAARPFAAIDAAPGLHILDVVSAAAGAVPTQKPRHVTFVASPTMLEMIAMRIEQLHRALGGVTVLVDSLSALIVHNGETPVEEFAHFLCNRMRMLGIDGELLLDDDQAGRDLAARLAPVVDEVATA